MVEQNDLRLRSVVWIRSDEDVSWVSIAVDVSMYENHLCKYINQEICSSLS